MTRASAVVLVVVCLVWTGPVLGPQNQQESLPSDPRLLEAVKRQDLETVRGLVLRATDNGVDVNANEADGATALHWAAYLDDQRSAELLLDAGADANAVNAYGVSPLALACRNANAEMVGALLSAGADATAAVSTGETVLMSCARTGNRQAVSALLARGADVNVKEPREHQTALMWAVAERHPGVVDLLLEHGADVDARSRVRRKVISRRLQSELKYGELGRSYGTDAEEMDIGGFTPLLFAVRQGDVESAQLLLSAGATVNDVAPDGASALVVAAHSGHRGMATFLLEHGANPNMASVGYTALHAAVLTGDLVLVKRLLGHGARPNAQVTLATPVTRNGQVLMIGEHLLGATPFALAAKFAEVEIMQTLAAAGADPILPLKNGSTPLMLAAGASWRYGVWDRRDRALAKDPAFRVEHFDEQATLGAVATAVDLGAAVNAVDADGNTALHHVVDKGFDRVVELLIESGAALGAINNRGQTPLAIVERGRTGNTEASGVTADLLRTLAGDPTARSR